MDYPPNLSEADRHWFDLIQECRTSGKSDRQWLAENNITSPTFYYHIKQLREKSCKIPAGITTGASDHQEVVPLIVEDLPPEKTDDLLSGAKTDPERTAIRLKIGDVTVEITNEAAQSVIQNTITALRLLC